VLLHPKENVAICLAILFFRGLIKLSPCRLRLPEGGEGSSVFTINKDSGSREGLQEAEGG
jgi:hypothetical protein